MTIQTLRIEPGLKPGEYKFLVDGHDISTSVYLAELSFHPGQIPSVRLHIAAEVDIPDELDAVIFTAGEKTNGNR